VQLQEFGVMAMIENVAIRQRRHALPSPVLDSQNRFYGTAFALDSVLLAGSMAQ
jgi:hypothetical protein